ncbi:MAG: MerR family transcriptional regulator [Treponema sp.]|nr:MerR family transcriptional regulator [Treponema sp.]
MYSIGDIEEITGVKAHVLRYWESVIPGFAPQKDSGGRRVYSQREVDIIVRLKYLINVKKFTIEGARNQIIEEAGLIETHADVLHGIHDLRSELITLYVNVRKFRPKEEKANESSQGES